ncbi:hypothetical protein AB4084_28840, partial [Lysobacter sp. 2RAB21]
MGMLLTESWKLMDACFKRTHQCENRLPSAPPKWHIDAPNHQQGQLMSNSHPPQKPPYDLIERACNEVLYRDLAKINEQTRRQLGPLPQV